MLRKASIEARLTLLTVTAGLAVAVVGVAAVTSVRAMTAENARQSEVQALLSHHQDADMMHDSLRGYVFEALSASADQRASVQARTTRDANHLRAELGVVIAPLAAVGGKTLGRDYELATQSMGSYADTAVRLVTSAAQVSEADLALFQGDFERTGAEMEVLTGRLRTLAADADAAAALRARDAQVRTGGVTLVALLVLLLLANSVRRGVRLNLEEKAAAERAVLQAKSQLEHEAAKERFTSTLKDAFEMAVDESEATDVVRRTVQQVVPAARTELLLADNSRAHLTRAMEEPSGAAPGCGVVAPSDCIAVRRSRTAIFDSADAIGSCPKLVGREGQVGQAVCSPVTFLGEGLGVLHTVTAVGETIDAEAIAALGTTADEVGSRIGTLRAFARSQLQANTDGLTGLLNRRTAEDKTAALQREGRSIAVAMCDLDHFKTINDTFGHEAGDRALRVFAATLKSVMRGDDIVARYGGEEFLLVMPDCSLQAATDVLERIRTELEQALQAGGAPTFTASFGVVVVPPDRALDAAVQAADHALMQAKQQGRNRTVVAGEAQAPALLPVQRTVASA